MTAASNVPWSVKGIDPKTREVAKDLARRSGMTLGEYLNSLITSGEITPSTAGATGAATDVTGLLETLSERIEAAEQRSSSAISGVDQSVQGVLARLEAAEHGQTATLDRLSVIEEEVRAQRLVVAEDGSTPVAAVKSLESSLGKLAAQVYAGDERTGLALSKIVERLERAEAQTTTAVRRLETSFAGLDDRLRTAEQRPAAGGGGMPESRFEQLATELHARVDAARAEMAQTLERAAEGRFDKIERVVETLTTNVEAAERRSHKAIESLGHEVLRVAETLGKRMVQVENRSADAIEQVGGEVARMAGAMESRAKVSDNAHAQALERLGEEIARISERLAERIAASERRSAEAIDGVGEQVARATDKLNTRYDRAAADLADRIRASEDRTARFLDEARERIDARLGDVARRPEPAHRLQDALARFETPEPAADPASPFPAATGPTRARLLRRPSAVLHAPVDPFSNEPASEPEPAPVIAVAAPPTLPEPATHMEAPAAAEKAPALDQAAAAELVEPSLLELPPEPPHMAVLPEPRPASEPSVEVAVMAVDTPVVPEASAPDTADEDVVVAGEAWTPDEALAPVLAQSASPPDFDDEDGFEVADEFASPRPLQQVAAQEPAYESLDEFEDLVAFEGVEEPAVISASPLSEPERDELELAIPVMTDPAPQLSTRDVLERARAAARAGTGGRPSPLAARSQSAVGTAPAKPAGLLAGLRAPSLRVPALRRDSTLRTALIASATAAALSVLFASWTIFNDEQGAAGQTTTAERGAEGRSTPRLASLRVEPAAPADDAGAALYAQAAPKLSAGDPAALAALRQAAELGHVPAQLHLATLYESGGKGVSKNALEARRWTERAAEAGDRRGMHNLGLLYFEGTGGPKDPVLALKWFRRAADLGLSDSQYNVGLIHERGFGVTRNPAEAYKWYLIAARSGDKEARSAAERLERALSGPAKTTAERAALSFRADAAATAPSAVASVAQPSVAQAQRALFRLGYYKGPADGRASPALRAALVAWQQATGAQPDGIIDGEALTALSAAG